MDIQIDPGKEEQRLTRLGDWLDGEDVPRAELLPEPLPDVERVGPEAAGCWLSGANHGWRLSRHAIDVAVAHGWPVTEDDQAWLSKWDATDGDDVDAGQAISEMSDDAVSWLNDHVMPVGYLIEFNDGDLIMWSEAAACAASGDVCSCTEPHDEDGEPIPSAA